MTEEEWLRCRNPEKMLKVLGYETSPRKLRLFAVSCWRPRAAVMKYPELREAVEAAEEVAEGRQQPSHPGEGGFIILKWSALEAAQETSQYMKKGGFEGNMNGTKQADLLRDLFGNPFRPVIIPADLLTWRDGTIRQLAESIYSERRFDDMPILGDAPEEAGCSDAAILEHCRGPNLHTRGCWLLDLLLGKQ